MWALAASVLVMIGVAYGVGTRTSSTASGEMVEAVLTAHVRSLQLGHLTDVVSTDQHTVKPWFTGKLDFSPAVPRLESEGFPLVGGRLDYVGHRAVAAALVYQRQGIRHQCDDVSIRVGDGRCTTSREPPRFFQIANWTAGGMTYWVVSDLNADELRTFCTLGKRQTRRAEVRRYALRALRSGRRRRTIARPERRIEAAHALKTGSRTPPGSPAFWFRPINAART